MNYVKGQMQQAPLQPMADQMAQYGRFGDSMMVHMNPVEVAGIAALSPTGNLTTNPVTGQPEAFLPFLAPMLGSLAGKALLGKTLGGAIAGAIGSGLTTAAITGDLKKGLVSGLTGYGVGQALGAASDALNPEIGATQELLSKAGEDAAQAGLDVATAQVGAAAPIDQAVQGALDPVTGQAVNQAFSPVAVTDPITGAVSNPALSPLQQAASAPLSQLDAANAAKLAADQRVAGLTKRVADLRAEQSGFDVATAPFREPGAFLKSLTSAQSMIPIAVGEGQLAEMERQEEMDRLYGAASEKRKEEERRAKNLLSSSRVGAVEGTGYDRFKQTSPYGFVTGGITSVDPNYFVEKYEDSKNLGTEDMFRGGRTSTTTTRERDRDEGTEGGPLFDPINDPVKKFMAASVQRSLRGPEVISPDELRGYRPGFDPEIMYFRDPATEDADTTTDTDVASSGIAALSPEAGAALQGLVGSIALGRGRGIDPLMMNQIESVSPDVMGNIVTATRDTRAVNQPIVPDLALRSRDILNYADMMPEAIMQEGKQVPNVRSPIRSVDLGDGIYDEQRIEGDGFRGIYRNRPLREDEGGFTKEQMAEYNERVRLFDTLAEPYVRSGMPIPKEINDLISRDLPPSKVEAFESDMMIERKAEGGAVAQTEAKERSLIERTTMALLGRLPEKEADVVIKRFIDEFGTEAFQMLRNRVLEDVVPGSVKEGLIPGTSGGMDDEIKGMIGDSQRVAVSPGEFIVPGYVVSGLGDGNSDAGAKELEDMMNRVRMQRTGTTQQPAPLNNVRSEVMPA